jgi:hypothetical protein
MRVLLGNAHHEGLRVEGILQASTRHRYQTNEERDLSRFGALDEVKPLLHACLILIIEYIGLQWGSR